MIEIRSCGAEPTRRPPSDWFTGTVWQDPIVEAPSPARLRAVSVTFAPGARTAWHTHPLGQTLHVLTGCGLVQGWGEQARIIRAGDSVWIPPGEKHWHGASPDRAMCHLAMQEAFEGSSVDWLEKVGDDQYAEAAAGAA